MKAYSYLAAFDLDKTILSVNSSRLIVQKARKAGIMRTKDYLHALYFSIIYKLRLGDPNRLVIAMALWLKGLDANRVEALVNNDIVPDLAAYFRPEILRELDFHRKNGARILLLSSAISYVCQRVAEVLEMDDVVSSEMEVIDGQFTGRPNGKLVFGKEKMVRMKEYCTTHRYSLTEAWYYGDALSDRFILSGVGRAVCVSPEKRLKKLAEQNGWQILAAK